MMIMNRTGNAWLVMTACFFLVARVTLAEEVPGEVRPSELPKITPGKPITLTEALRLADQQNLSLKATRTNIAQVQAKLKSSWGTVLTPLISATMNFQHNDHADTVSMQGGDAMEIRRQDDLSVAVQISSPIINTRAWYGVSLAKTEMEMTTLSTEKARQTLLLSVAQAYFQALTARSLIDIQENQVRSSEHHLKVASMRYRTGTGRRVDVIRARTEIITAQENLLKAHTSLDNARDALSILIGFEGLPMPTESSVLHAPRDFEERTISKAISQREDIKIAKKMIELSDKQLSRSWMQFVPSLNGSGHLSYQITEPSSFGSQDKFRWFIGLTLSVPLFDYTRYGDLDQKRASLSKAKLQAAEAELHAKIEVRKAIRNYHEALALVESGNTKATLSNETLSLAEKAYESGTGSSLEVTDAHRSNRAAEINLAIKRFNVQLALLGLLRAAGEDMGALAEIGTD